MRFFLNKHVVIALIVAPLLAVLSYFAVDLFVQEKPQPAKTGQSYPLLVKSNCRYESGQCDLKNAQLSITLHIVKEQQIDWLVLSSNRDVQQVLISIGDEKKPQAMYKSDNGKWKLRLPSPLQTNQLMQLVVKANSAYFYAQVSFIFAQHKPIFKSP